MEMVRSRKFTDEARSSNSQVRIPNPQVVGIFLGVFPFVVVSGLDSKHVINKTVEEDLRLIIFWYERFSFIHCEVDSSPHMQVAEVPIAVPSSWRKYMSPHSNMLLLVTSSIASLAALKG